MAEFNEKAARIHYRLLNHADHHTLVHCQHRTKGMVKGSRRLIRGEEQFIEWCREFNGRGDCFVGKNPRNEGEGVVTDTVFVLDLDPERENSSVQAAPVGLVKRAEEVAGGIVEFIGAGIIGFTGNGFHVYYRIKKEHDYRKITDAIRTRFKGRGVKIDAIWNRNGLVKVIGTTSTKGDVKYHRQTRWVSSGGEFSNYHDEVLSRVVVDGTDVQNDEVLRSVPLEPKRSGIDRSAADYALCLRLKQSGYDASSVLDALRKTSYKRSDENYLRTTVSNAFKGDKDGHSTFELYGGAGAVAEYRKRSSERRKVGGQPKIATGFPSLDRITGGLKKKGLWIVGARTNVGKSALGIGLLKHALAEGRTVLFFSTEMGLEDVFDRLISADTGIPVRQIEEGRTSAEEDDRIDTALRRYETGNLHISDEPQPRIESIASAVSRIQPDILVFDHLQRAAIRGDSMPVEIGKFLKQYKNICISNNCAGLITSQLSRDADFEAPALRHLQWSSAIEQEATTVVLLSPVGDRGEEKAVSCFIAKHKGKDGISVPLALDTQTAHFREVEHESTN